MAASIEAQSVRLSGEITAEATLTGRIELDLSSAVPLYKGECAVRPAVEAQELECAGKRMTRNVEIEPIPLSCVSNESGGKTVTIG